MPKEWEVTLPIAGHAYLVVQAETAEEAIEVAMNEVVHDSIETWEAVHAFHEGNVCYCPQPWTAEATCVGEVEE